jgi:hypothetical protein
MLSVICVKCLKIGLYAECHYAECRSDECRYAECFGVHSAQPIQNAMLTFTVLSLVYAERLNEALISVNLY